MNIRSILHVSRKSLVWGALLVVAVAHAATTELKLEDGSVLRGEIVEMNDSLVTLRTATVGTVTVARPRVVDGLPGTPRLEIAEPARRRRRDPAGYALFLLPTAFTPEAGTTTFRDFELFFLNFGHSLSASTVVSGGFLFPITTEFQLLTFGLKQQVYKTETGTAVALTGNVTVPVGEDVDGNLVNGNILFSHRIAEGLYDDALGVHAGLGFLKGSGSDESVITFGAGFESRLTGRAKFITEYYGFLDEPDMGIINLGFRLHADRLSADIAGTRPLDASGSFLFFPLLIINYRF